MSRHRTCNRCKENMPLTTEFFKYNSRVDKGKTIVYMSKMCIKCLKLAKDKRDEEYRAIAAAEKRPVSKKFLTRGKIKYEGYVVL